MLRNWGLPALITVLALADGVLHLALDFILFRGNLFGRLGPPPGGGGPPPGAPPGGPRPGPPPLPLPLNQLFFLNLVGYVVLVLLFWFAPRFLGRFRWLVDAAMIVYVGLIIVAWAAFGQPNPAGYLGYLSKTIEVVLIVALIVHLTVQFRSPRLAPAYR